MMHGAYNVKYLLEIFQSMIYIYGIVKTIVFVCSRDTPLVALRIKAETDVAVNLRLRYRTSAVYAFKRMNPENVLNRDLLQAEMELEGGKC